MNKWNRDAAFQKVLESSQFFVVVVLKPYLEIGSKTYICFTSVTDFVDGLCRKSYLRFIHQLSSLVPFFVSYK